MTGLDAISPLSQGAYAPGVGDTHVAPSSASFHAFLSHGLRGLDESLKAADQNIRMLAAGQEIAPHDVMISLEEARMHLTLMVEVRNRVVEAYQELARMQL